MAAVQDQDQWFQVDMLSPYKFTKVYTQGREDMDNWVTSYRLSYLDDQTGNFTFYTNGSGETVSAKESLKLCHIQAENLCKACLMYNKHCVVKYLV